MIYKYNQKFEIIQIWIKIKQVFAYYTMHFS